MCRKIDWEWRGEFAREHNLIVVLKGHRTLVVKPDGETWVNTTGNPGMSTGGTGDILTGMVAAMMAQTPQGNIAFGVRGSLPAWTCGRRHARSRRRAFDGCDGSAGGLPDAFKRAQAAIRQQFVQIG